MRSPGRRPFSGQRSFDPFNPSRDTKMNIAQPSLPSQTPKSPAAIGAILKVVAIYDDAAAQEWAVKLWGHFTRMAGAEVDCVGASSVRGLNDTRVRRDATWAAIDADIILVSIHATEEFSAAFCCWMDAWVALRPLRAGVLIAVVDGSGRSNRQVAHTRQYLHAVARRSGLKFLLMEHLAHRLSDEAFDRRDSRGRPRHGVGNRSLCERGPLKSRIVWCIMRYGAKLSLRRTTTSCRFNRSRR